MHQNNLKTATSRDFFFYALSLSFVLDISNFVIGILSNDSVYHNVSFVLTGCPDFNVQSTYPRTHSKLSFLLSSYHLIFTPAVTGILGQYPCRDHRSFFPSSRILRSSFASFYFLRLGTWLVSISPGELSIYDWGRR